MPAMVKEAGNLAVRIALGAAVLLVLMLAGIGVSESAEIIPSVGVTRATHDDDGDTHMFGGLACAAPWRRS